MRVKKTALSVLTAVAILSSMAYGAGEAPAPSAGSLGRIAVDPYGNAPLTAVVFLENHDISNVKVTVHGKGKDGVEIAYPVGKQALLTHGGVPVFGLYANYKNQVTVEWTENGKKMKDNYSILTSSISNKYMDNRNITDLPQIAVKKVDPKFKERLYLVNSFTGGQQGSDVSWAGAKAKNAGLLDGLPSAGSMAFTTPPMTYMIDTQGEFRWWLDPDATYDQRGFDPMKRGYLTGINKTPAGTFVYGQGITYGEFDALGRFNFIKKLPAEYIDFSHEARYTSKDTILLRVAKARYKRPDGQIVHTVRDHVIEVDMHGKVIDEWDFNKILDPLRDSLLGALDSGAVCLNVNSEHAGETVKLEPNTPFGDAPGVGAGRNWIHINAVEYDPKDDSIIVSARHQGVFKIGRDKQIKWILTPNVGWNEAMSKKVLTPVDTKGKKLDCEGAKCQNTDFDWPFTQHSAWLSSKGTLTVFDNGDGRGYEQPAMKTDKYSRFVEYKIDEKNMTVQQVWEFGKEKGFDWYSPITSNTEYRPETDSMFSFSASVGLFNNAPTIGKISEVDYKTKKLEVEIDVLTNQAHRPHYRALVIDENTLFSK